MANNSTSGGAGFTTLLQIAFIVLKLCNVVHWSWWWVLSPTWITVGIVIVFFALYGILKIWAKDKPEEKKEYKSKWQQRMEEMQARQKQESN